MCAVSKLLVQRGARERGFQKGAACGHALHGRFSFVAYVIAYLSIGFICFQDRVEKVYYGVHIHLSVIAARLLKVFEKTLRTTAVFR